MKNRIWSNDINNSLLSILCGKQTRCTSTLFFYNDPICVDTYANIHFVRLKVNPILHVITIPNVIPYHVRYNVQSRDITLEFC